MENNTMKASEGMEKATFSLGCFWAPDAKFGALRGVLTTRTGYVLAADSTLPPRDAFQITFDPAVTAYTRLLDYFWLSHSPVEEPWKVEYTPTIFCHNEEQKRKAEEKRNLIIALNNRRVYSKIAKYYGFRTAESHQQKYALRTDELLINELTVKYPDLEDFLNSVEVTKVNSYLAGYGKLETLLEEIRSFNLSSQAAEHLIEVVAAKEMQGAVLV